jgi:hypothetical protein
MTTFTTNENRVISFSCRPSNSLETWRNGSRNCLLNSRAKTRAGSNPVVSAISIFDFRLPILDSNFYQTTNPKSKIPNPKSVCGL